MERTTVNALAKAMGGKLYHSDGPRSYYALPSDEKVEEFRRQIPFLTLWGCSGKGLNSINEDVPLLQVMFDKLRDY